VICLSTSWHQL